MASHFFLVFLVVTLTISNGTLAADTPADNKSPDNSTKSLINSLGPSQEFPDYDIPKELAPGGVEVVPDYVPMNPNGATLYPDPYAPPVQTQEDLMSGGISPPSAASAASRSSSTVLTVLAVAAAGGATLFFF